MENRPFEESAWPFYAGYDDKVDGLPLIDDAITFGANMTAEEEDDITVVVVTVL